MNLGYLHSWGVKKNPSSKITSLPSSLAYSISLLRPFSIHQIMFAVPVNGPLKGVPSAHPCAWWYYLKISGKIFIKTPYCPEISRPAMRQWNTTSLSVVSAMKCQHPNRSSLLLQMIRLPCIDKFSKHWPSNMRKLPIYSHLNALAILWESDGKWPVKCNVKILRVLESIFDWD